MVCLPQLFRIMKDIVLKIAKLLKNVIRCKQSSTIGKSETKPEWKQSKDAQGRKSEERLKTKGSS